MSAPFKITNVIGTPCLNASIEGLLVFLEESKEQRLTIDFTNVHITAARSVEPEFKELTDKYDYFVPDSQVLKWAVNLCGGKMDSRVYGPEFLTYSIKNSKPETRHYLLGGSQDCLDKLIENAQSMSKDFSICGSRNGYFKEEDTDEIIADIQHCNPDFIWVGLGTPKQQEWIIKNAPKFGKGVFLAVGFAFDVNAGTKKDAPVIFQKMGMTWFHRLICEPRRLWWRYLKYNTIFLWALMQQIVLKRNFLK